MDVDELLRKWSVWRWVILEINEAQHWSQLDDIVGLRAAGSDVRLTATESKAARMDYFAKHDPTSAKIEKLFHRLPAQYKQIIETRYLGGDVRAEAKCAQDLGMSHASLRVRLYWCYGWFAGQLDSAPEPWATS